MESPLLNAPPLRRTAAVMWNRCHIPDRSDFQARYLQGANRGIATGARALHTDFQRPHSHFACSISGGHSGLLRSEGRALARSLKAERTGAGPAHYVAFLIS